MIDTHSHIYLPEFDQDLELVLEKAKTAGIIQILMPAIDSSTHEKMLEVENKYIGCLSMIGLHPCSVNQDYTAEIQIIKEYLRKRKFVAIGEIGLDFYWDKTFTEQQYQAFTEQINLALQYKLPIVIHSRNAIDECIEVVTRFPELTGVFHCFSGTLEQAKKIISIGFMLGIGGVVTFKNAGLDKVLDQIGLDNIILETDAPYLAPVPYRGKRNEPAYLSYIIGKLKAITNKTEEEIDQATTSNAKKLFVLK
jgi:TatD DNase family protein